MAVTYAFSIHTFINDIGAYVGFAAAIGLALFSLLLFAQARELKRLREWGAHAHDRLADVERRLAGALELARRANAAGARPQPATGAVQRPAAGRPVVARTSAPTKLPLLPAAPAGVAGPALASATMLVRSPAAAPVPAAAVPAPAVPGSAPLSAVKPGVAAAPPQPTPSSPPPAAPETADAPRLTPATAAAQAEPAAPVAPAVPTPAGGNGRVEPPSPARPSPGGAPAPSAARPGGVNRQGARPSARPGQRPVRPSGAGSARPAAAPLRARTPSATPRTAAAAVTEPGHGRRRLALLLGIGVAFVIVVVAVIALTSGGSAPSGDIAATPTTGASSTPASTPAPPHSQTTVAVLNGTTTPGLAATVASQLASDSFKIGRVTDASSQDRTVTVVSYYGGHEREAAEVAKTLGVPADAVQPIDPDTEAVVCPTGAGTCPETVVATAGADRQ